MAVRLLRPIVFAILLCFAFANRSLAAECDIQELLVQAHHLSTVFAQQRRGPNAESAAKQLNTVLNRLPAEQLSAQLRSAGLSTYRPDISGFIRTQQDLVNTQISRGGTTGYPPHKEQFLQNFAFQMQQIIPKLRCETDKSWRPENVGAGIGGTTPTGGQGGGNGNAMTTPNAAVISMIVLGAMAALIATSILLRRRAKAKRRRARRLPCALDCTVSFFQQKQKSVPPTARRGTMCDISQLGAKVSIDDSIPESLNDCNLYSHGWTARGRIIWRNAQYVGIAFRRKLSAQELYRLVKLNRKLHAGKKNGTP